MKANKTVESLPYIGVVTVKVMRGKTVVNTVTKHNRGTALLFKSLSSFLCGYSTNEVTQVIPRYIDAIGNNGQTLLVYNPSLTGKVVTSYTAPDNSSFSNVALFTAHIPYEILGTNAVHGLRLLALQRTSSLTVVDPNTLAEVALSEPVTLPNSSYSLVVEWAMVVSNPATTSIVSQG